MLRWIHTTDGNSTIMTQSYSKHRIAEITKYYATLLETDHTPGELFYWLMLKDDVLQMIVPGMK